jgi:predicted Rdx family selenoprotein
MKTKLIGIFVCTLLIATAIPVIGQVNEISISKDTDEINPLSNGNKWIKTFDLNYFDAGYSVQQTGDGGYIVVGSTIPTSGDSGVWMIKTDNKGNMVWDKKYEGGYGHSVKQTSDGGYIIEGAKDSPDNTDIWLIKTDEDGDIVWEKTFGDNSVELSYDVEQTNDGGYIVTGFKGIPGNTEGWLLKIDESGELEWYSTYGESGDYYTFSVVQTLDGGYVVSGGAPPFEDTDELAVWLFKTDSDGEMLWEKTFVGGYNDGSSSVQLTDEGGYIITGITASSKLLIYDILLMKTDGEGELLWRKTFGGVYSDWGYEVQQTSDGGYIIIGEIGTLFGTDALLIKTNSDGEEVWSKTYGDRRSADGIVSGQQTGDGGFILTGLKSNALGTDVLLIKTDSNGDVPKRSRVRSLWNFRLFELFPNLFLLLRLLLQRLGLAF